MKLQHFTSQEIRPRGWLKRQLQIQAEGLSGHLAEVWPDIRDSAWIGGDREGWERVPYWLDGFIPLAWLLEDEKMQTTARKYVDAILNAQQEDGWICPCSKEERAHYDTWAVLILCKALMTYGECSGDVRAEQGVYRALRNLQDHLRHHTLFNWGQSRWFEGLIPLGWLYQKRPEPWMKELAVTLHAQGLDWEGLFENWQDQSPRREWSYQTHIVNLMMALKSEAVYADISGKDPNAFAQKMYRQLTACHGSSIGHILGDECLAGQSPVQGAELCSIVEAMYSFEILHERTGDPVWLDRAEELAFNSLPATISEDMWTHQYDQMENQIACARQNEPAVFLTNGPESNLMGLEPNFGCCTANFNQGWPKLSLNTFMKTERGILSAVLAPAQVNTAIDGHPVEIRLDTDYPFDGRLCYTVNCPHPVTFPFSVRIPSFAGAAAVNGRQVQPGSVFTVEKTWNGTEQMEVQFTFRTEMKERPEGMFAVRRGPLFFALPIKADTVVHAYEKDGVERKYPFCDYEHFPAEEWAWGFASDHFQVIPGQIGDHPFSRSCPPIQLEAHMGRIAWGYYPGQERVCAPVPKSREVLEEKVMRLQPYGCTTLRMTVMPLLTKK